MDKKYIIGLSILNAVVVLFACCLWVGKAKEAQAQPCVGFQLTNNGTCPGGWTLINNVSSADGWTLGLCAQN